MSFTLFIAYSNKILVCFIDFINFTNFILIIIIKLRKGHFSVLRGRILPSRGRWCYPHVGYSKEVFTKAWEDILGLTREKKAKDLLFAPTWHVIDPV